MSERLGAIVAGSVITTALLRWIMGESFPILPGLIGTFAIIAATESYVSRH